VRNGNEILLVQGRGRGNLWGLPGGFWKRNETPEEGLRRELAEEIGLIGEYAVTPVDQYRQETAPHLDFLYCVQPDAGFTPIRNDRREIRRVSFFALDELPALLPEASLALRVAHEKGFVTNKAFDGRRNVDGA
jgi:ADP-ribose pyrophosphatase YjhB (NUDIX family)